MMVSEIFGELVMDEKGSKTKKKIFLAFVFLFRIFFLVMIFGAVHCHVGLCLIFFGHLRQLAAPNHLKNLTSSIKLVIQPDMFLRPSFQVRKLSVLETPLLLSYSS